jgi:hypothetical protein
MNTMSLRTVQILTYSGILPFVLLGLASVGDNSDESLHLGLRLYSVMIISFLCGIHWACHLLRTEECPRSLLMISNIITLAAFTSLFFRMHHIDLIIQTACFFILACIDYRLFKHHVFSHDYFTVRCRTTCAVVFILLGVAVAT